jgi:tRNA nucleotidyltransferase (CCA-adding enzyme)
MADWFASVPEVRLAELGLIRGTAGGGCYLVGGFVRDRLLGLAPDDFDVVIEGDAITLGRNLAKTQGGEVVVHAPFGTATWRAPSGLSYDLVSARRETYPAPAVLPRVSLGARLDEDLARRDFTVNSMALALGESAPVLHDPLGGQADLRRGLIRALHPRSFFDDPTRLFRAVRYEQRYGFAIEPETLGWMSAGREALPALSGDRARHELSWIVAEPQAGRMLARLETLGLWSALAAGLRWGTAAALGWADWTQRSPGLRALLQLDADGDDDLAVALALVGAGGEALSRLAVSRRVRQAVQASQSLGLVPVRVSQMVAALDSLGPLGLVTAWAMHPTWRDAIERYGREWRAIQPHTTGADLIARGLLPGPDFGRLLTGLRAAILDGEVAGPDAERAWLARQHDPR